MQSAYGISYAKIILIGEHAVVYHQPAIALPVSSIRLSAKLTPRQDAQQLIHSTVYAGSLMAVGVTPFAGIAKLIRGLLTFFASRQQGFDLTITSALPSERGMGSSAATAVAIIRAFYQAFSTPLSHAVLLNWAGVSERAIHGNPSGLDAATTSATRPQWFIKGTTPRPIAFPSTGILLIADTGVLGQTKQAVDAVAAKLKTDHTRYFPLITHIGVAVRRAAVALTQDDLAALGKQMNAAQADLSTLGVSSAALNKLVAAANQAGALGSKLTGSGQGGCMISLAADQRQADKIHAALVDAGATQLWQYDFAQSEVEA